MRKLLFIIPILIFACKTKEELVKTKTDSTGTTITHISKYSTVVKKTADSIALNVVVNNDKQTTIVEIFNNGVIANRKTIITEKNSSSDKSVRNSSEFNLETKSVDSSVYKTSTLKKSDKQKTTTSPTGAKWFIISFFVVSILFFVLKYLLKIL